jgi:hypothetical protein
MDKNESTTIRNWHFDFVVEGLNKNQADWIMAILTHYVELWTGGKLGGGFHEETEADDEQQDA